MPKAKPRATPTPEWFVAGLTYSDRLATDELLRTSNENTFRADVLHQLMAGASPEQILANVRTSDEWKEKHQPAPPTPPAPVVPGANGLFRLFGQRAAGDDDGAKLYVGLSRFALLWFWKHDRDRVLRWLDRDRALGYRYLRVFAQVANMGTDTFWTGREIDADASDHSELIASLTYAAAERGLLLLWTIIGKGGPADSQRYRVDLVRRVAQVLRDVRTGVLIPECVNEPGFYLSLPELRELYDAGKEVAPNLPWATGAVWTEAGWAEKPEYFGATGFSPEGWAKTQGIVGIAHLDRDTSKGEMQDRPWRQGWDVGLEGRRWIDNERIGPGSSVNSENRGNVLRSHAAVAFICRAFATCLHGKAGVRGDIEWEGQPGYIESPRAIRGLPGDLVNGRQHNARDVYPDRPFDLPIEYVRSENGNTRGIVRCYTCQAPDGTYYSVPFGPVSDYRLVAVRPLHVTCTQQDANDVLWERDFDAGEVLAFTDPTVIDYLLMSKPL